MFTNVLLKFFTRRKEYENKAATRMDQRQEFRMALEIKAVLERSRSTLVSDALGAVSLIVMLVAGLSLPGLF
jgi:hypothetical protein